MRISNAKTSATESMTHYAAGKDRAGSNKKTGRFHVVKFAKILAISLALLAATPTGASAHTALSSSNPTDKSTIQQFPADIELTFNETLMTLGQKQVSKFSVHNPKHQLIKLSPLKVVDNKISASVLEKSPKSGTYKIYYRVISADGHPVSGIISFNFKSESANNEIEVLKPFDFKHFWHLHKWHTLETIAALLLILAWAIYRRKRD